LRRVQALPQAQRFEILLPLLELDMRMALLLIGSAQLSQAAYLQVFNEGPVKGDASSVSVWMKATVPHLGWPVVFSILRNAMPTKPQGVANALYHVPYLCAENAPQPALSGPLPSQELADEYFELVVKSQKNGYRWFQTAISKK
jgi:hypothetical protein